MINDQYPIEDDLAAFFVNGLESYDVVPVSAIFFPAESADLFVDMKFQRLRPVTAQLATQIAVSGGDHQLIGVGFRPGNPDNCRRWKFLYRKEPDVRNPETDQIGRGGDVR